MAFRLPCARQLALAALVLLCLVGRGATAVAADMPMRAGTQSAARPCVPAAPCDCHSAPGFVLQVVLDVDGCRACRCVPAQADGLQRRDAAGGAGAPPPARLCAGVAASCSCPPDGPTVPVRTPDADGCIVCRCMLPADAVRLSQTQLAQAVAAQRCAGVPQQCECAAGHSSQRSVTAAGCLTCLCVANPAQHTAEAAAALPEQEALHRRMVEDMLASDDDVNPLMQQLAGEAVRYTPVYIGPPRSQPSEPGVALLDAVGNVGAACRCAAFRDNAGNNWPATACGSIAWLPCPHEKLYGRMEKLCQTMGGWSSQAVNSICSDVDLSLMVATAASTNLANTVHNLLVQVSDYVQREAPKFTEETLRQVGLLLAVLNTETTVANLMTADDRALYVNIHDALRVRTGLESLMLYRWRYDQQAALDQLFTQFAATAARTSSGVHWLASQQLSSETRFPFNARSVMDTEMDLNFVPPTCPRWTQVTIPLLAVQSAMDMLRTTRAPGAITVVHSAAGRAFATSADDLVLPTFTISLTGLDTTAVARLGVPWSFTAATDQARSYQCLWWNATMGQAGGWDTTVCLAIPGPASITCACYRFGTVAALPPSLRLEQGRVLAVQAPSDRAQQRGRPRFEDPTLALVVVGLFFFFVVCLSQWVQRRHSADVNLQQNQVAVLQALCASGIGAAYILGEDSRLALGSCASAQLVTLLFIYGLMAWIVAALIICRRALLRRPFVSMMKVHGLVWSSVAFAILWHGVAHRYLADASLTKHSGRPCVLEGVQQYTFWALWLTMLAFIAGFILHLRQLEVQPRQRATRDPVVAALAGWAEDRGSGRLSLVGIKVFVSSVVLMVVLLIAGSSSTSSRLDGLRLAFAISYCVCGAVMSYMWIVWQPGVAQAWQRQLGLYDWDPQGGPSKPAPLKRKHSDLPERLIMQAKAEPAGMPAKPPRVSHRRKSVELEWDNDHSTPPVSPGMPAPYGGPSTSLPHPPQQAPQKLYHRQPQPFVPPKILNPLPTAPVAAVDEVQKPVVMRASPNRSRLVVALPPPPTYDTPSMPLPLDEDGEEPEGADGETEYLVSYDRRHLQNREALTPSATSLNSGTMTSASERGATAVDQVLLRHSQKSTTGPHYRQLVVTQRHSQAEPVHNLSASPVEPAPITVSRPPSTNKATWSSARAAATAALAANDASPSPAEPESFTVSRLPSMDKATWSSARAAATAALAAADGSSNPSPLPATAVVTAAPTTSAAVKNKKKKKKRAGAGYRSSSPIPASVLASRALASAAAKEPKFLKDPAAAAAAAAARATANSIVIISKPEVDLPPSILLRPAESKVTSREARSVHWKVDEDDDAVQEGTEDHQPGDTSVRLSTEQDGDVVVRRASFGTNTESSCETDT